MTELTKEQLIEEAKLKIAIAKCHPNSGVARVEGELFKIALTSLEAEPIAWECGENIILFNPDTVEAYAKRAEISPKPLFSAPPALVVPDKLPREYIRGWPLAYSDYAEGWNDCREAMLQSGNFRENKNSSTNNFREIPETSTNSPVTPALLPGGFTIEDAKELHEDLVRSHISQALSGEKMKKENRDADLRWIHGVIVQAACFVKASLEVLPELLREEKGGSANCTASYGTTDNLPVPSKQINELTMLVKQLVSQLKKVKPDCKLPDKAMDYLKRNGLISVEDVLR